MLEVGTGVKFALPIKLIIYNNLHSFFLSPTLQAIPNNHILASLGSLPPTPNLSIKLSPRQSSGITSSELCLLSPDWSEVERKKRCL